jgi:hypothetical protein
MPEAFTQTHCVRACVASELARAGLRSGRKKMAAVAIV